MKHFDVCVIGGGPAGYSAAMRAIDLGKRTLLVEKDRMGGTGIYDGALSSKTLWEISQRITVTNTILKNKRKEVIKPNWSAVTRILKEAQVERKHLYTCHMQILQHEGNGMFHHMRGIAKFTSSHTVRIDFGGKTEIVSAEQFVIATGSRPRPLPNAIVDEQVVMTSDGIGGLDEVPASIVIIGAGVIGCEFATIFSNMGCNDVHLIDRAQRILPFEDEDISEHVTRVFRMKGVTVHGASNLVSLDHESDQVRFVVRDSNDTSTEHVVEKALISIGRIPNLEKLDIENAGLFADTNTGKLKVENTRTNMPHIYCVGDANGKNMLVNMGEQEGRHAIESYWSDDACRIDYANVSSIMFLEPEVAGVGRNERQCREEYIPYRVARMDYATIARAIAMRRTEGFIKLIVSDDEEMNILGIRVVGEHASSAIQAVALMIKCNIPLRDLAEMVHPHPSITEGVQECARILLGKSTFKSKVFNDKMKCYSWRPGQDPIEKAA